MSSPLRRALLTDWAAATIQKAALITRGIAEIKRLGITMGAHAETLTGLSGIGDLIVTCASQHSRNRKAGYLMGQGYTMREAMDEVKMVVEGYIPRRRALTLSEKYRIDMPIVKKKSIKYCLKAKTCRCTLRTYDACEKR